MRVKSEEAIERFIEKVDCLKAVEECIAPEKSWLFSTWITDYVSTIRALLFEGWAQKPNNSFEIAKKSIVDTEQLRSLYDSNAMFFVKGNLIGILGYRPNHVAGPGSFLNFTILLLE